MTSDDISSRIGAWEECAMFIGAWRSSQKSRWRVEARATSVESHISSVGRSVVEEVVMATRVHKHDLEVRESEAARGSFSETIEARGTASGDRISRISLQETEEHAYMVGFFRRSLDVHRSDRERHELLGLEDLDTAMSHGSYEMLWSLDPADKYV